jgi:hypothetical protein
VKTELSGKIRDRVLEQLRRVFAAPGLALLQVTIEVVEHGADLPGKITILQAHAQFVIRHFMQHGDGVVIKVLPAAGGQRLKNLLCFLVPRPPEIAGH